MDQPAGPVATTLEAPVVTAQIRARDPVALERVVESYFAQVLRAARGAGLGAPQAEDVAQDTFTTFIEAAPRFEGRSSVRTWLFGILYKKIAAARRSLQRDRRTETIDETVPPRVDPAGTWSASGQPVETDLFHREMEGQIFTCLDEAPPRLSLAFVLREVQEIASADIRDVMGITQTNLDVMLHRIRHRVRKCLEAKGLRG